MVKGNNREGRRRRTVSSDIVRVMSGDGVVVVVVVVDGNWRKDYPTAQLAGGENEVGGPRRRRVVVSAPLMRDSWKWDSRFADTLCITSYLQWVVTARAK